MQTFYKLVSNDVAMDILENGLLKNKEGGSWMIHKDDIDKWAEPNPLFGSLLQALLFFPSRKKQSLSLLEIHMPEENLNLSIRNVDLMLRNDKEYRKSMRSIHHTVIGDHKYTKEVLMMSTVEKENVSLINSFTTNNLFHKNKYDGQSVLRFIKGECDVDGLIYSGKINTIHLIMKFLKLKF